MADTFTFGVAGLTKIQDNLKKYSAAVLAKVQDILEYAGQEGLVEMDANVPVDTGFLQGQNDYKVEPLALTLYNDADYALYVETGHYTADGSFVEPQPFIIPAAQVAGQIIVDALIRL